MMLDFKKKKKYQHVKGSFSLGIKAVLTAAYSTVLFALLSA